MAAISTIKKVVNEHSINALHATTSHERGDATTKNIIRCIYALAEEIQINLI